MQMRRLENQMSGPTDNNACLMSHVKKIPLFPLACLAARVSLRSQVELASQPKQHSVYALHLSRLPMITDRGMGVSRTLLLFLAVSAIPGRSNAKLPSFDPEFFQFDDELVRMKNKFTLSVAHDKYLN